MLSTPEVAQIIQSLTAQLTAKIAKQADSNKVRADYLHYREQADTVLEVKDQPQDLRPLSQLQKVVMARLRRAEDLKMDCDQFLTDKLRENEADKEDQMKKSMRASFTKLEALKATISEYDSEIAELKKRMATNIKIMTDLEMTLVSCFDDAERLLH